MINDKVVSLTKKEWLCSTLFINFYKILSQYLIKDLLQFVEVLLFLNFHNKSMCSVSLTSFGTLKYDCEIKAVEIFSFLPLINNSVTTGLSFLLLIISERISSKTR